MRQAIEKMSCKEMKGLGPAGASAVLAIYRPELFTFMGDQILELIHGDRNYEVVPYLNMNQRIIEIAISLNFEVSVEDIGKAIYVHEVLFRGESKLGPGKKLINGDGLRRVILASVQSSISKSTFTTPNEEESSEEENVNVTSDTSSGARKINKKVKKQKL